MQLFLRTKNNIYENIVIWYFAIYSRIV